MANSKLDQLLVVVYLICITVTSSLPGCLSVRPFPEDKVVVGAALDPTMRELNPSDSDSAVSSASFEFSEVDQFVGDEEEVMTVHPCYATLAEAQIEEGTDPATTDSDSPLVEVDCRRMLADYLDPKPNTNPKCSVKKKC